MTTAIDEKVSDERIAQMRAFHWMKRGDAMTAAQLRIDSLSNIDHQHHSDLVAKAGKGEG